ncbi:unnamed protein product [Clonostachys rosea f. rosea IK726]|uniref:Cytochrome P450 n=2 Tax=Bionectria ochroleuca TaxID=29856 RepID=A0A0B7KHR0_BIOOC|nr:unnamed protein product [Clonostachys rosea f. rosea IK726]
MGTLLNSWDNAPSLSGVIQFLAIWAGVAFAGFCWAYRSRGILSSSSANGDWIPKPRGQAFKGNSQELQTKGAASCKAWYSLYQRYGPAYEITVPYFRLHVINHPRYLEYIQKTNSKNYIRGAFTRNVFGKLHRSGIFVADGKEWQTQRKAATRAFSKQNFERHITKSLHYWLDILMRLLSNLSKTETEFDFQELMGRFLFCIFLRIAFHEDELALDILSDKPESLNSIPKYVEAFDKSTHLFDRRRRDPIWKLTEKLSGEDKITDQAVNLFYEQMDALVKKRIDAMASGYKYNPEGGVDLLDLFMQSTNDPYELSGMIFAFLIAGRDTTTYSIAWLMKEIFHDDNKHLDAVSKIRVEASEIIADGGYLEYANTSKMQFTHAMWDETSRLNTVSPAGQMEAAEDDVLPAVPELNMLPRKIKKGDIVSYQNYVLSRMPEVWGDDAGEFKPERWFDEDGKNMSFSPFKYHSWNAGPRSCLGRPLATYEGISIAAAIIQRFDVIMSDTTKTYEPLAALNMGVKDGVKMRVWKREDI